MNLAPLIGVLVVLSSPTGPISNQAWDEQAAAHVVWKRTFDGHPVAVDTLPGGLIAVRTFGRAKAPKREPGKGATLHLIDGENGATLWEGDLDGWRLLGCGDRVLRLELGEERTTVAALDRRGAVLWERPLDTMVLTTLQDPDRDELVLLGLHEGQPTLTSLTLGDGSVGWHETLADVGVISVRSVSMTPDIAWIATGTGMLKLDRATGQRRPLEPWPAEMAPEPGTRWEWAVAGTDRAAFATVEGVTLCATDGAGWAVALDAHPKAWLEDLQIRQDVVLVSTARLNSAELHALDLATGQPLWSWDFKPHGGFFAPVVIGGVVMVARKGGFEAIDLLTGSELWTVPAGQIGPRNWKWVTGFTGLDEGFVVLAGDQFLMLDPSSGTTVWEFDGGWETATYAAFNDSRGAAASQAILTMGSTVLAAADNIRTASMNRSVVVGGAQVYSEAEFQRMQQARALTEINAVGAMGQSIVASAAAERRILGASDRFGAGLLPVTLAQDAGMHAWWPTFLKVVDLETGAFIHDFPMPRAHTGCATRAATDLDSDRAYAAADYLGFFCGESNDWLYGLQLEAKGPGAPGIVEVGPSIAAP